MYETRFSGAIAFKKHGTLAPDVANFLLKDLEDVDFFKFLLFITVKLPISLFTYRLSFWLLATLERADFPIDMVLSLETAVDYLRNNKLNSG